MRSGRAARALATTAALGLAAAALAGCAADGDSGSGSGSDAADARLHPVGAAGAWISEAYVAGSDDDYATPNTICAVTAGMAVELQEGPGLTSRVIGRTLHSGAAIWEREDAKCAPGSLTGAGSVVLGSPIVGEVRWRLVDAETGRETGTLPLDPGSAPVTAIGAPAGDVQVFRTGPNLLVGVADGEERWRAGLPANAEVVPLADGVFGVASRLDDELSVLDGATGETLLEADYPTDDQLTWASDGMVERINQSDPEYAYFGIDGEERDRTVGESQYRFVPSPEDGVVLPIADHAAWGRVVGVDASGRPALWQDDRGVDRTAAGPIEDLPKNSILALDGVSAHGSLLMFRGTDEGLRVLDATGETVFERSIRTTGLRVESGYIILESELATRVLLPRG